MEKGFVIKVERRYRSEKFMMGRIIIPSIGFICDCLEYSSIDNDKFHLPLLEGYHELNTLYIDGNPYSAHVKYTHNAKKLFVAPIKRDELRGGQIMVGKFDSPYKINRDADFAKDAYNAINEIIKQKALERVPLHLFLSSEDVDFKPEDQEQQTKEVSRSYGMTDKELEDLFNNAASSIDDDVDYDDEDEDEDEE